MLSTLYKLWEKIIMKLLKERQKSLYKFRLKNPLSFSLMGGVWRIVMWTLIVFYRDNSSCWGFEGIKWWLFGDSASLSFLPMDSSEQPPFICMAHFGRQIKCELLGGAFITDFRQENHSLEEEKANGAASSSPTKGLMVLLWRRNILTFLPTSWEND